MRNLARAAGHAGPGGAMKIALHPARHDLGVAMVAFGVVDQPGNQQRLVLHQAQHGTLLGYGFGLAK